MYKMNAADEIEAEYFVGHDSISLSPNSIYKLLYPQDQDSGLRKVRMPRLLSQMDHWENSK